MSLFTDPFMFIRRFSKPLGLVALGLASLTTVFYACRTKPVSTTQPAPTVQVKTPRILVFAKTKGWYHTSIPSGMAAIQKLGRENNFQVDTTKNAAYFVEDSLKHYSAVVFLSTTQNVLDPDQQVAFERYIQAGGGYVGIHAAADTEYNWPWYNKLVGAYFASHPNNPNVREATVDVLDTTHISTKGLPTHWPRKDEWYNYKSINPDMHVLANLDEDSYEGGTNGSSHPIAWYHEYDGGRAFYTGGGHTDESFSETLFVKHLLGGIQYAIGENKPLDYSKSYAVKMPEDNRFVKTILTNDLNEPMELAVAPDGRVFFVERAGKFYVYEPAARRTRLVHDFPVKAVEKYLNGLLGMTIDPDFAQNHFLYFFYTVEENKQLKQRISRFVVGDDSNLDVASEKVIISFPIDAEVSAHTGGSLAWDKDKNLYISTGDNTVPFESNGFAPIDQREGRPTFDAQRSAGNPNDLRGKILRIHPQADGSYTVPQGNLFAQGTPGTRPEIYIMGCRNPYRISVDQKTGILYWGEIGPDSGTDSPQGPRGYDEFNQARKAGNFGWPYFVGDSKPYHQYDFATKAVGELFNPEAPINNSPNNTGAKNLPPAQKAMIWYPYNKSEEFPELGDGGRCAIGGPVYHFDSQLNQTNKIPAYYDKALFVLDWMRNWIFAVRLDENQNFKRMEPFMSTNGDFRRPVDMEVGPDGAFYILEYGSVYGIDNEDARLVKVEFNPGNRAPVAKIISRDTIGIAPLKVTLNSRRSYDFDEEDKLTYEWNFGDGQTSTEPNPTHTFEKNGVYSVILKVSDPSGQTGRDTLSVKVGNTIPQVAISTTQNGSFFYEGNTPLAYTVDVKDNEDKSIDKKKVQVVLTYIPKVSTDEPLLGHQQISSFNLGKTLMASSDCKACHQISKKSVGPAFMEVSKKYAGDKTAVAKLANKVITGGGGVWGDHAMNAHPQLSRDDATEIVKYVLSLSVQQPDKKLPAQGNLTLKDHVGQDNQGRYVLTATYTDQGGAITPMTGRDVLVLRPNKVMAAQADVISNINRQGKRLGAIHNKSYFVLKNIDLKGVDQLTYRLSSRDHNAAIEVHMDSPKGQVISTLNYTASGSWNDYKDWVTPIQNPGGKHDLYFVFVKKETPNQHLASVESIEFGTAAK